MDERQHDRTLMSRMGHPVILNPAPETEMVLQRCRKRSSNNPSKESPNNGSDLSQTDSATQNNHLTIPIQAGMPKSPSQGSSATPSSSCSMNSNFTHYKNTSRMTNAQARLLNSPYLQPIISFNNPCLKNNQQLRNIYKSLLPMTTLHSKAITNAIHGNSSNKKLKVNTREPKSAARKLPNISLCCEITIKFTGGHSTDRRHQVRIYQQRCGGTPVSVYTGCLETGETFSFVSKRQHGFPFSITLYVDGMLIQRLSTCCEYKHRQNCKLGGSKGQFVLISVKGSFPCYRCQLSEGRISLTPPSTKFVDNTEPRTPSASSSSEKSNSASEPESENGESGKSNRTDYEDDFDDGEDDQLTHDGPLENPIEQQNASEVATCETNENANETSSKSDEQVELPQSEYNDESKEALTQPSVNTEEGSFDGIDNGNENIESKFPSKALEDVRSQSPNSLDNEQEALPLMAIEQATSSHGNDDRRDESASSSEDDHSTSNDDADTSITSPLESNTTDDDDVVCQADFSSVANEDYQCTHDPMGIGGEWIVQASPCCKKRGQEQWTAYRDQHHQQFDSSDEEDANDTLISPRVTVTADVHASGFESPRTTKVSLQ